MKKILLLWFLLAPLILLMACSETNEETDPTNVTPVIPWEDDGPADINHSINDFNWDEYNGSVFGISGDNAITADDLNLGVSVLPNTGSEENLDFDFGTPLELGNTGNDTGLPLESGLPLETGDGSAGGIVNITPVTDIIFDNSADSSDDSGVGGVPPLEIDDNAANDYVSAALNQPGDNLPKTNDLHSNLAIMCVITIVLAILILVMRRRRVGA